MAVAESMLERLEPPMSLPVEVRSIWDEVTSSVGPTHFRRCDSYMLAAFCVALHATRVLEREVLDDPTDGASRRGYVSLLAQVTSIAGKLRLMPSTRNQRQNDYGYDPGAAGAKEEIGDGFFRLPSLCLNPRLPKRTLS